MENGQKRILKRIYDGVTSDLFLDVSDFKESDSHKTLHLVWRKFPRNRHSTEGQTTTMTLSTQTDKVPSAVLDSSAELGSELELDSSAELTRPSRNSFALDMDCLSVTDKRRLFNADKNALLSGIGLTSDNSYGQKTIISHSTQTEEVSGLGLNKISKNSIISDTDCFSATDLRGIFDANDPATTSDSDPERTSFSSPLNDVPVRLLSRLW